MRKEEAGGAGAVKQKGPKGSHKFLLSQAVATSPPGQTHVEWGRFCWGANVALVLHNLVIVALPCMRIPKKRRELSLKAPSPPGAVQRDHP